MQRIFIIVSHRGLISGETNWNLDQTLDDALQNCTEGFSIWQTDLDDKGRPERTDDITEDALNERSKHLGYQVYASQDERDAAEADGLREAAEWERHINTERRRLERQFL